MRRADDLRFRPRKKLRKMVKIAYGEEADTHARGTFGKDVMSCTAEELATLLDLEVTKCQSQS